MFCILLAVGVNQLGRLWQLWLLGVTAISLTGLSIYWTDPRFQREDWRAATNEIPANAIFAWPVPFDPYIWYGGKGVGVIKEFPIDLGNEVYLFEYLQALSDPEKRIQKKLEENGYEVEKTLNYNGVGFVYKYKKNE